MSKPLVEILYFEGCPNHEPARALVERTSHALGIETELRLVEVVDNASARRCGFLGSPTIRVNGRDIDPQPPELAEYSLSCRLFRTEHGTSAQPDPRWVRDALRRADLPDWTRA